MPCLWRFLLFSSFCVVLVACSRTESAPTLSPTPDGLATALAQQAQPTAVATLAPSATPTVTPSPSPTATFTATSTPSPTVTASASPSATFSLTPSATASPSPTATLLFSPSPSSTPLVIMVLATQTQIITSPTPLGFIPSVVPRLANATATPFIITAPTQRPTLPPGVLPTNTPRISPTPTVIAGDHFWFWRPFSRDRSGAISDSPARGYAYGSTSGGGLQVHHGVDIQNPTGTPVRAIGSGRVYYAGDDMQVIFGPRPDFYGNVVVIEHDYLAPDGRPIYSLYGHLSRVDVTAGQRVDFGQTIAAVGATGVAFGPHLHLEIRLGTPLDYYSTYNPELWVTPYENHGVLAARILGPDGTPIKGLRVELIGRGSFLSGWTYETDTVNSDPYFQENLVIGDIRAGQYDLKVGEIRNILYRDVVFIEASVVNLIEIRLPSVPLGEGS